MFRVAFAATVTLIMTAPLGQGETARDVFVLSIGSGDYVEAENPGAYAFADNDAAYLGAQRVARIFNDGGARYVLQLLGRDGEYLSSADIYVAVDDIATKARGGGTKDPVLIVYFSGHGISESLGFNLFLAPGDLTIPNAALNFEGPIVTVQDVEGVGSKAPTALALKERLDASEIPYLLVLDTCFETNANLDLESIERVSQELAGLLQDVSAILRFYFLPRGPHPVVFSTLPGTLVLPEKDPSNENSYIGPLARRLTLIAKAAEARGEKLDLAKLVGMLTRDEVSLDGRSGVTWFDGPFETGSVLAPGVNSSATMDLRRGTARAAQICCQ